MHIACCGIYLARWLPNVLRQAPSPRHHAGTPDDAAAVNHPIPYPCTRSDSIVHKFTSLASE